MTANSNTTHIAKLALEWWRNGGEKTRERLLSLVKHFAHVNAEINDFDHHWRSALASVYPWEKENVQ